MNMDDLILVSVDDHVVEPPDVFEKHLPAKYQEFAPKLKERDDGTLAWYYYEHEITNVGLNAVAGPAEGGVRHRADPPRRDAQGLLGRRRAHQGHERRRRSSARCASRRCRGSPAASSPSAKDDDIAGAMVKAYNDWHVHEWCGKHPGRFIPLGLPMIWSAEADGQGGAPPRRHGLPRHHVPREPGAARPADAARPVLGSVLARRRGARHGHLHAHRLVVEAGDDHARRADRRADHPAADDHRAGRRRPRVEPGAQGVPQHQDRPVRGRHRVGAVLPRPHRAHLRHAPPLDRPGPR